MFYQENLINAHIDTGGSSGKSIEDRFLEILLKKLTNRFIFRIPPIVCGVGGGSGKYYKASFRRQYKDLLKQLLVMKNPRFRELFNEK